MSDPRYTDPRLSDPVLRREEGVGGTWGWIAGIAVIALVAFLVIAGWNGNSNTANNVSPSTLNPPTITSSVPPPPMSPPSTTGSGSTSPQPMAPASPTVPQSSPKSGTQ
jgi:hypothetical protein